MWTTRVAIGLDTFYRHVIRVNKTLDLSDERENTQSGVLSYLSSPRTPHAFLINTSKFNKQRFLFLGKNTCSLNHWVESQVLRLRRYHKGLALDGMDSCSGSRTSSERPGGLWHGPWGRATDAILGDMLLCPCGFQGCHTNPIHWNQQG